MATMNAMVLAAGLGKRMRPITDHTPKPLVEVAGKALIDYGFDALKAAGVPRAVVNIHYLADKMRRHLSGVSGIDIAISDETEMLLDSGGGIVHALPLLGPDPFIVLNADTFWLEETGETASNISRLIDSFDPARMDITLMTARLDQATGHNGTIDFTVDSEGRLSRYSGQGDGVIYAGAAIVHPRVFDSAPDGPFSLNRCFDVAIADGRLYGAPMQGRWITVGTPDAIADAEAAIAGFRRGGE